MKIGDEIEFYLFSEPLMGVITKINKPTPAKGNIPAKGQTVDIKYRMLNYPGALIFKTLPKKKKEIPPWYVIKNKRTSSSVG
jgi:hypothetical protein|tara:strand:- start:1277 stop:1522 length:246 start_codon:yes stop_codon:yes gene_type:complete